MSLSVLEKQKVVTDYRCFENDTGSVEVQVALLTCDIQKITEHCKVNKQDLHSRRGLIGKVNKRRKLLKYVKSEDLARYRELIKRLGLREI